MPAEGGGRFAEANANAVAFADAWAAEARHLSRLARGLEPAWWADRLRDGRGDPLDLRPGAVLARWLERHPARAVAAMADLVDRAGASASPAALAGMLPAASASALAFALANALSWRPAAAPAPPATGTPLRALLEEAMERLRRHRGLAALGGVEALPWRLAVLLRHHPSLALLPAVTLLAVAKELDGSSPWDGSEPAEMEGPSGSAAVAADRPESPGAVPDPARAPRTLPAASGSPSGGPFLDPPPPPQPAGSSGNSALPSVDQKSATASPHAPTSSWNRSLPDLAGGPVMGRADVQAGGLLLLLQRPDLWNASDDWSTAFGDVALLALRRLLQPLGPGERAVALERERPLLTLLCPDRSWPERLEAAEPLNPRAAAERLEALIAALPRDVAFAPGALRQVYGPLHGAAPPLPDRAGHGLAALLWRPGVLVWDAWQIALHWPLASADVALRRAGWDLDPGWQPALRRVVRFLYGGDAAGGEP
jgi:hypothetical protein